MWYHQVQGFVSWTERTYMEGVPSWEVCGKSHRRCVLLEVRGILLYYKYINVDAQKFKRGRGPEGKPFGSLIS